MDVSARLGVSVNGLYKWVKAVRPYTGSLKGEELIEARGENAKLRADLWRIEEKCDILQKAMGRSASNPSVMFWQNASNLN